MLNQTTGHWSKFIHFLPDTQSSDKVVIASVDFMAVASVDFMAVSSVNLTNY